ncbi:chemotaxis protein CheW [Zooshikella marina]|uniref:Chemotaxis protein CheW n=1 Tax=Zooshikella ganghwensis TaxID=202772 RepID=A0A4P9VR55_9GAMM|nr:chemotaxis protein CheW [Zooshikella ganghwensis]MBU2707805.1 chemotaxis protein CheW [Zooshikella ganghwensis]RDH46065.1 chemotaxis protein CheW [Zooshikella ganghwensis]
MSEVQHPFELLQSIARRCRQHAAGLPAQTEVKAQWSGIGFRLANLNFVAPMGEVAEILPVPNYTQLPGVQSWVKGIANVRGRLLPIMDLPTFLGHQLASARKSRRILVVEHGELFSGLVVDEVMGMQHFPVDGYSDQIPRSTPEPFQSFLTGSYEREDGRWLIFSLYALAEHPSFSKVAV